MPLEVATTTVSNGARPETKQIIFDVDEGPRADSSLDALAKLKPIFHVNGSVTAGNSSQTSDAAAAAIVMSGERARALGLKPLARDSSRHSVSPTPVANRVSASWCIPASLPI